MRIPGLAFTEGLEVPIVPSVNTTLLIAEDLNGNGIKDIAVANVSTSANSVTIMTGKGDGIFGTPTTMPGSLFTYSIAAGNFD